MDLERVRLAYAQGWVESGGPMTERVKAGCVAAMELAAAFPDMPDLLEVTLQTGKLEGHWASVYADREAVHTHHAEQVSDAYRRLLAATINVPAAVRAFRSLEPDDRRAAAQIVARRLMYPAMEPALPEYRAVVDAVTAALVDAAAAGRDAAKLIAGPHEFDDGDRDTDQEKQRREAGALVLSMLRGTTTDAARAFTAAEDDTDDTADDAGDGAGEEPADTGTGDTGADAADLATDDEIADSITSAIADVRAAAYYADLGIAQAFMDAMVSMFTLLGHAELNWITVGDREVCSTCARNEDQSPYTPGSVPSVPHGGCRCLIQPA